MCQSDYLESMNWNEGDFLDGKPISKQLMGLILDYLLNETIRSSTKVFKVLAKDD